MALPDMLASLFDRGGLLLWVILALSTLMWGLILERYDFLYRIYPRQRDGIVSQWRLGKRSRVQAEVRRQGLLTLAESRLRWHLVPIQALTQALPLLGLLGTVTGMIKVFDVLTVLGTANARAMAAGISEALITTLAGLVTALSGLYFASHLSHRIRAAVGRLALEMSTED